MLHYNIPIRPIPQQRPRVYRRDGRIYAVNPSQKIKNEIAKFIYPRPAQLLCGPIEVKIEFYYKGKTSGYCPKYADIDNLAKLVLDALNGIIWEDDKQIVKLLAEKKYAEKEEIRIFAKIID